MNNDAHAIYGIEKKYQHLVLTNDILDLFSIWILCI